MDIKLGDILQTKKNHPCGSNQWEVLRTGIDFRIKCLGCGHVVMLPRTKLEKSIKKIITDEKTTS
ncbi:MAG: DUF951 domain-containing protein [Lachnospiraceae bacterium]|nr:DUF951 domain-containing protein [Lachnospiraceae bacterium]